MNARAMVFAAGLGTRLKPLTDNMPKALVPVGERPLLWHVLMKLKAAGCSEIVVNVHHFAEQIIDYVASQQNKDFSGLSLHISDERDLLRDTGGGILYAEKYLNITSSQDVATCRGGDLPRPCEPFLVHNVDVLTNLSLEWLTKKASPEALATLVASERQTSRYFLFDSDMRLVGWTNISTGEVRTPFPDLKVENCRKLAFAGIHLISPDIFKVFREMGLKERFSITDFYISVCGKYPIYGVVPDGFRFMDIGKIGTLPQAEAFLASL